MTETRPSVYNRYKLRSTHPDFHHNPYPNPAPTNQIKSNYFIVRLKVDQRAGQLSLPHLGITKTEKNRTKT